METNNYAAAKLHSIVAGQKISHNSLPSWTFSYLYYMNISAANNKIFHVV
jgi:hypothetical protein